MQKEEKSEKNVRKLLNLKNHAKNLISELGKEFKDSIFAKKDPEQKKEKFFENTDEKFISWPKDGICIVVKSGLIDCIFLYFISPIYKTYKNDLPYGLRPNMTNGEVVSFLGEPNIKSGGGSSNITLIYKRLGLEFEFYSKVWHLSDAHIAHITLFSKEENPNLKICGVCRKVSELRCSGCKLVYYCSKKCQNLHWKFHKIDCKSFSVSKK